ncbi:MAG: 4'-phosphopantetheinyl transferase superfamily protein [Gracilimonas sp.]|nr:4'-phosphopantetheinyl transferase superfamily protein [Gracilimonas sp.]
MDIILKKHIPLTKRDIHIWKFEIDAAVEDLSVYQTLLNKYEEGRASKFKFSEDRERFLWGRILLKRLLGAYLDENTEAIILNSTSGGKPFLEKKEHQHIQFNVSHSGNIIILGFSRSPIGVDVEMISRQVDIDRVSRNYFSMDERKAIDRVSEESKEIIFFDIWTKKEAVIKGIGKGLGIPLKSFNVLDDEGHVKWKPESKASTSDWYVHYVDVKPAYKAAFATSIEDFELSYFSLNE